MVDLLIARLRNEARRIWCYRWLVIVTTITSFAGAWLYIHRLPNVYDAWSQIYVEPQTPLVSAAEGVSLVGKNYGSPYVVLTTLLNDGNLEKIVRRTEPAVAAQGDAAMAGAVQRLRARIRRADPGDGFIELHVSDTDPVRARDVVQMLMEQLLSANMGRGQHSLEQAGKFLDEQIASYGSKLAESQANIAEFRRSHPEVAATLMMSPAGRDAAGQLGGFVQYAPSSEPPTRAADPDRSVAPAPSPADLRVAELETKLATLRTTYTERYPDVVATRRQLADAIAARDLERTNDAATRALQPHTPRRQTEPRRSVIRTPAPPPPLAPDVATRWADLQRTDEVLRTNYQQLLIKRAATQMSLDVFRTDEAGKYQVVRPATVPVIPTSPNRLLYLIAAGLVSVAAGVGVGYARGATRGILVSSQELEELYQIPVIGAVSWEPAWHMKRAKQGRMSGGGPTLSTLRRFGGVR